MTQEREAKRGGGRPRNPKIIKNADGTRSARMTLDVEGETVRKVVHLGTSDRHVAKARVARLARGEGPELVAQKKETFQEVADDIMKKSTLASAKDRARRLRQFAYPILGEMDPADITVDEILECLDACEEHMGAFTQSVRHLKNDISAILGALHFRQRIDENVALRISYRKKDGALGGKKLKRVVPLRLILTDDEIERLIQHGVAKCEGDLSELYMLCVVARCLGGMRTSDLHAWRWEHVDTEQWLTAYVPRPKTKGTEGLEETEEHNLEPYDLPSELVTYLASWWRRHGCPSRGPVFPVRRGPRAGQQKDKGSSYAQALRDALWEAGVVRPQPGFAQALPEDRRKLCALQAGTVGRGSNRAAVDFHSFRRAFVTATLSQPGLSVHESARLADHSDLATHARYDRGENRRVIPEGALPRLPRLGVAAPEKAVSAVMVAKPASHSNQILNDSRRARVDSNHRPSAPEADEAPSSPEFDGVFGVSATSRHAQNRTHWQN